MNKKLYVGGLSYSVTDDQLRELFAAHGTVESAKVITDKFTGQSRGFGFVEMGTQQEAEGAIAQLNGTQHMGRTITVNISKPARIAVAAVAVAVDAAAVVAAAAAIGSVGRPGSRPDPGSWALIGFAPLPGLAPYVGKAFRPASLRASHSRSQSRRMASPMSFHARSGQRAR